MAFTLPTKKLVKSCAVDGRSTTKAIASSPYNLLFARDTLSGTSFLIDTGAALSLIPIRDKRKQVVTSTLRAANGSKINVYGERLLTIDIGLQQNFQWKFLISDVEEAIIGADFLRHNQISVDIAQRLLIDNNTNRKLRVASGLTDTARIVLSAMTFDEKYKTLFKKYENILPSASESPALVPAIGVKHYITTKGNPCHYKPRPLAIQHQRPVKEALSKMLDEGVIRPSKSNWASPLHVVPKKPDGWRLVGDYRYLNSVTVKDTYALPYLQDFSSNLHGMKIFSRLDLKNAFWQVEINECDIPKTAIATPYGTFEFLKMNFGLSNASQSFQRYINQIMWDLKALDGSNREIIAFTYVDDILVASRNEQEHFDDLDAVFSRLSANGLKLNISKCEIGVRKLNFLGHLVSEDGISPLKEKVEAISNFTRPQKVNGLRRFLGMLNYYRRFVPHAAQILSPLFELVNKYPPKKKNLALHWDHVTNESFEKAKLLLAQETLLVHPSPDATLTLSTDASNIAVGAVLHQTMNGVSQPLAFFSRKLSKTERKYSTFGRELLAIYLSIKNLRRFIEGRQVTVLTDHKPLLGALLKADRDIARETRQLNYIAQYTTTLQHISGPQNVTADTLSRADDDSDQNVDNSKGTDSSNPEHIHISAIFQHSMEQEIIDSQQNDPELLAILQETSKISVKLEKIGALYCERNGARFKPFIPKSIRRKIFQEVHSLSHPGARATLLQIRNRFFWPGMNKDVKSWARQCIHCQKSKVTRHNSARVHQIKTIGEKFSQIHVDIVGPIFTGSKYTHMLTVVDRFSRWCEVYPLESTTADTVANVLLTNWVSRFGVPVTITTDRGSNFESKLFQSLTAMLGSVKLRTTAYHPQANSLVERFHRTLKQSLRASLDASRGDWTQRLPLILLSLRTALRQDDQLTPAQIVYGTNLRLPVDLLIKSEEPPLDVTQYTERLTKAMQSIGPIETRPCERPSYIDPNLKSCTHVFIRNENRRGLNPVYTGPFEVVARSDKFFKVKLLNRVDTVSIDRLKAAHTDKCIFRKLSEVAPLVSIPLSHPRAQNMFSSCGQDENAHASVTTSLNDRAGTSSNQFPHYSTRSGRQVRKPSRFL